MVYRLKRISCSWAKLALISTNVSVKSKSYWNIEIWFLNNSTMLW